MGTYCKNLKIVVGDITRYKGDAIVNAANCSLLGGGGVDGAIHRAAGRELLAECKKLGGCETGQSKITDAYRLPCKKVIHTVGPVWHGGSKGEGRLLASCYDTALELAKANGLRRIAFPCISTGVYHFPKAEAARIALHSIFAFIRENTEQTKIGCAYEITIVCFCEEDVQFYRDCFWEESLTLLGKRDEVKAFNANIDMLGDAYWNALFASVIELEENQSTTIILPSVKSGAGVWGDRFEESLAKHIDEINDFYALCVMACLWMYRQYVDWSEPGFDRNTAMSIIKALQEAKDQSFKVFRIVQFLHSWGYENVRLSPQTSNLGNLYYIITTKNHTSVNCGAMCTPDVKDGVNSVATWQWIGKYSPLAMPEKLARQLLIDVPLIKEVGIGEDKEYVRWFGNAVEEARQGHYFYTYGDYYCCLRDGNIAMSRTDKRLQFPSPGTSKITDSYLGY